MAERQARLQRLVSVAGSSRPNHDVATSRLYAAMPPALSTICSRQCPIAIEVQVDIDLDGQFKTF